MSLIYGSHFKGTNAPVQCLGALEDPWSEPWKHWVKLLLALFVFSHEPSLSKVFCRFTDVWMWTKIESTDICKDYGWKLSKLFMDRMKENWIRTSEKQSTQIKTKTSEIPVNNSIDLRLVTLSDSMLSSFLSRTKIWRTIFWFKF